MVDLPISIKLHNAIEPNIKFPKKKLRGYLGYSGLNDECPAKVWFGFRWAAPQGKINAKRRRIFERGDLEESRIIRELSTVGIKFFRRDEKGKAIPITGHPDEEQEQIKGFAGHSGGHPDGRVLNVPFFEDEEMLFEAKTMGNSPFSKIKKLFKEYIKSGSITDGTKHPLEAYSSSYYGQVQLYMGKMGLQRTLYVCSNKNNEERLYEIIEFDQDYYQDLCRKDEFIVQNEDKLPPAYKKGYYKCDYCPFIMQCHFDKAPQANCRTCRHVILCDDGIWQCGLRGNELSLEDQIKGCDEYTRLF